VEASWATVSQFASKQADAWRRVVHVALSRWLHQSKSKMDGLMRQTASDPATLALSFLFY
jgi:hypothetical protein